MSGGSYNYFYRKVDEFVNELEERTEGYEHYRLRFLQLMKLVSKAAHDIEWVDSCDYAKYRDIPALQSVFDFLGFPTNEVTINFARESCRTCKFGAFPNTTFKRCECCEMNRGMNHNWEPSIERLVSKLEQHGIKIKF